MDAVVEVKHGAAGGAEPRFARTWHEFAESRAALVGLVAGRARRLDEERSLDELEGLADAAGARVVLRTLQERPKPDPATFLGSGKIQSLASSAMALAMVAASCPVQAP